MVKIRFENSPKLLRSMKEKGWGRILVPVKYSLNKKYLI